MAEELKKTRFGRYSLVKMLARGGMGEIYLATLEGVAGFEKRCVIKKIRKDLASDSVFVERFLHEGHTLVELTHSNIVQIFDMGVVEGEYYLAMEYVDGADLRNILKNIDTKKVPVGIAVSIIMEVLKGLGYAHHAVDKSGNTLGIVHRDISPSNILISKQGEVKIIDFGIAKVRTDESVSGVVQGKFAYMSPEQAKGESLDAQTDIFSVGVVLYEMLSGIKPFESSSDLQSLEQVKTKVCDPISEYNPEVDDALDDIVRKALCKDKKGRYSSADAFYDALDAYMRARSLTVGQREIKSFFEHLMNTEQVAVGMSVDSLLASGMDGLMMSEGGGERTKTVIPAHTDASEVLEKSNRDDGVVEVAGPSDEKLSLPTKRRMNRLLARLRYLILGALIAAVAILTFLWVTDDGQNSYREQDGHQKNAETVAAEPRDVISFANTLNSAMSIVQLGEANPVSNKEPWIGQLLISMTNNVLGNDIPISIKTDPEFATIYVVEGAYSHLEGKNVTLLRGTDVEIAIQAPGFETCLFHIYLSSGNIGSTDSQNCRSVSSFFSADWNRIDISIALNRIMPGAYEKRTDGLQAADIKQAGDEQAEVSRTEDSISEDKRPKVDESNQPRSEDNQHDDERQLKKDLLVESRREIKKSTVDKTEPGIVENLSVSVSIEANIPAEVIFRDEKRLVPCQISGDAGEKFQIVPVVSGRQVGISKAFAISANDVDLSVSFCESIVRIQESYVDGDPAPYQVSDIYVDGVLRAEQTDVASFVLPCGRHTFSASSRDVDLKASTQVMLDPGKLHPISMVLE